MDENDKRQDEEIRRLVAEGASVRQIGEALGITVTESGRRLRLLGLQTRRMASRGQFDEARQAGLKEAVGECHRHGLATHIRRADGAYRCSRCSSEAVSRRRRNVKLIPVEEAGGRCEICGYSRCVAALQFHHVHPGSKRFGLAVGGLTRGIDDLRAEASQCVLLCANCHAEVEVGYTVPPGKAVPIEDEISG